MRDFQLPGRSTAHALNGMAATSHPLASLAAIDMLRAGGNAIDAAIAASAVLAVVEPQSTGIGGDCFMLLCPGGTGEVIGLNGSGRAPAAATAEWYLERGMDAVPLNLSPHCVTVPGAVDAWARLLADHGTMDFAAVLAPAIDHAENGYVVAPRVAWDWQREVGKIGVDETARQIFLPQGRTPRAGEVHRQPLLAETLKALARDGRDAFYTGAIAEEVVAYLRGLGGLHTLDDFADHRSDYVTPIRTTYRGYEVVQIPPNGQGITVLLMLNILAGYPLGDLDPLGVERLHLEAEATRLAYRARDTLIGDPSQADVPVERLLSADYAERLRCQISPDRAMGDLGASNFPVHPDTVYLTVVDRDRNAVSFINSLFNSFGSGLVAPRSGFLLQNRGAGFVVAAGHANCIGPGKRPLHTIIPGMVQKDGRAVLSYGVMGGYYQPVGHTHLLTNIIDYGMDVQEGLDLARAFHVGGDLLLERGIGDAAAHGLAALGHRVGRNKYPHGGGQAIWIDWENGALIGGSEPRKDGIALGY